jgi:hypothetical protein
VSGPYFPKNSRRTQTAVIHSAKKLVNSHATLGRESELNRLSKD